VPKKGNYNQDHYKVRGKEPGNQDVETERARQEYGTQEKAGVKRATKKEPTRKPRKAK
jgi:hypothetical protein